MPRAVPAVPQPAPLLIQSSGTGLAAREAALGEGPGIPSTPAPVRCWTTTHLYTETDLPLLIKDFCTYMKALFLFTHAENVRTETCSVILFKSEAKFSTVIIEDLGMPKGKCKLNQRLPHS